MYVIYFRANYTGTHTTYMQHQPGPPAMALVPGLHAPGTVPVPAALGQGPLRKPWAPVKYTYTNMYIYYCVYILKEPLH